MNFFKQLFCKHVWKKDKHIECYFALPIICTKCDKFELSLKIPKRWINENKDKVFLEGFDAAIEMVITGINASILQEHEEGAYFLELIKDEIIEEVELYKAGG